MFFFYFYVFVCHSIFVTSLFARDFNIYLCVLYTQNKNKNKIITIIIQYARNNNNSLVGFNWINFDHHFIQNGKKKKPSDLFCCLTEIPKISPWQNSFVKNGIFLCIKLKVLRRFFNINSYVYYFCSSFNSAITNFLTLIYFTSCVLFCCSLSNSFQ